MLLLTHLIGGYLQRFFVPARLSRGSPVQIVFTDLLWRRHNDFTGMNQTFSKRGSFNTMNYDFNTMNYDCNRTESECYSHKIIGHGSRPQASSRLLVYLSHTGMGPLSQFRGLGSPSFIPSEASCLRSYAKRIDKSQMDQQ